MSTLNAPLLAGIPEANRADVHHDNYLTHTRGFLSWALTLDHKRIAIMYMVGVMTMFAVGGLFALLLRIELLTPGPSFSTNEALNNDLYNQFFTIHGAVMVFLFIIPAIPAIIGNFVLPIMLGAKDVAFPRLNLLSFYIWLIGAIFFTWILLGGTVTTIARINLEPEAFTAWRDTWGWIFPYGLDTGWTFYTPYSTTQSTTGVLPATLGAFILGFSSILTGLNFIASIHMLRPKGMTWFRMPLFLWGIYSTSIIQVLATPVLAITLLLLVVERSLHVGIFDPGLGGDPVLYQHFFWFYSHPAVYIMILPGLGTISEILSPMCRKHIFGYSFVALSSIAIAFFSFIVWGHHMFTSGQSPLVNAIFSLLTFSVSIPSAVKVFNWLSTMYRGRIMLKTPMWYVFGAILVFTLGGLTGLHLATISTDIHFHDTYFVVAHFHYVMMGTTLFALLGAFYYWYPKMWGRMYPERWGQIGAIIVILGFNVTFLIQFVAGSTGMPRRYATYEPQYEIYHQISTVGSWILGLGLTIALINLFMGRKGKIAPPNPWGANTLEWQTSSPPPHDNFKITPAAGDPYALRRWRFVHSNDPAVADGWELKPEFRARQEAAGPGHRVENRPMGDHLASDEPRPGAE
jgi:cytochrome c oxidase subunit 1